MRLTYFSSKLWEGKKPFSLSGLKSFLFTTQFIFNFSKIILVERVVSSLSLTLETSVIHSCSLNSVVYTDTKLLERQSFKNDFLYMINIYTIEKLDIKWLKRQSTEKFSSIVITINTSLELHAWFYIIISDCMYNFMWSYVILYIFSFTSHVFLY